MLVEHKNTVVANNHKGSILISNDLIEHIIKKIVNNSSNYIVKKVSHFLIKEFVQQCFVIELSFDEQVSLYEDEINTYQEHLKELIASNLNISNFNLIMVLN